MVPHLSNSSWEIIPGSITICTGDVHVDGALLAVLVLAWIMIRTKSFGGRLRAAFGVIEEATSRDFLSFVLPAESFPHELPARRPSPFRSSLPQRSPCRARIRGAVR